MTAFPDPEQNEKAQEEVDLTVNASHPFRPAEIQPRQLWDANADSEVQTSDSGVNAYPEIVEEVDAVSWDMSIFVPFPRDSEELETLTHGSAGRSGENVEIASQVSNVDEAKIINPRAGALEMTASEFLRSPLEIQPDEYLVRYSVGRVLDRLSNGPGTFDNVTHEVEAEVEAEAEVESADNNNTGEEEEEEEEAEEKDELPPLVVPRRETQLLGPVQVFYEQVSSRASSRSLTFSEFMALPGSQLSQEDEAFLQQEFQTLRTRLDSLTMHEVAVAYRQFTLLSLNILAGGE